MRWDIGDCYLVDVTVWFLAKILRVGFLTKSVIVGGKNAMRPSVLKRNAEPTDAAEQIDETEWLAYLRRIAIMSILFL